MKRIIPILATAVLSAFVLSSCVKDEEMIFDKSASLRVQEAMDNAQKVLTAASNGWKMYYYPHPDRSYGGYVFGLKFADETVEVWSDQFAESSTSLYKMTNDDGPVLSVDTGNHAFHYFTSPSGTQKNLYGESGLYEGHKGDFEFIIMKATPEVVILKGKRNGNLNYLYPLDEDPAAYVQKAAKNAEDLFVSSFAGTIGSDAATASLDLTNRQATLSLTGVEDATVKSAYLVTDTGIRFYKPVTLGAYSIESLDWVNDSQSLVSPGGASVAVNLVGQMPAGWRSYKDLLGEYELVFNDTGEAWYSNPKTATVTLVEDEYKKTMWLKGVNEHYDIKVLYDLSQGDLTIMGQIVGQYGANDVYWAPLYARNNGKDKLTYSGWRSTTYGMKLYADDDASAAAGTIVLKSKTGPASSASQPITGFGLLMQTPAGASGGWMSMTEHQGWWPFGYQLYAVFWASMTKK